jgi:dihydrofolate synthase/folylpolyglutamate synthase
VPPAALPSSSAADNPEMTYPETLEYLYSRLPVFHRIGAAAYKPGLGRTIQLLESVGNPQYTFKSIHIAGTNGKGSSSHSLASVLQEAGYKTGLYTSPHLFDFRERIRINGRMIPENRVIEKVAAWKSLTEQLEPSFFELTVALAFDFFAEEQVDFAVIEVGMGGRLDSTNVITPELSLITNIGFDHQQFLGDTLPQIAFEKAGIIKSGVPVIISEALEETASVFTQKASDENSAVYFAGMRYEVADGGFQDGKRLAHVRDKKTDKIDSFRLSLGGNYQMKNLCGILASVEMLREKGFRISEESLHSGLEKVKENTGLRGRWDVLRQKPLLVCDTAHNEDGIREVVAQLNEIPCRNLWMVWGMVNDKEHAKVISLLPRKARMLACQPDIPRALSAAAMHQMLEQSGFKSTLIENVGDAIAHCLSIARPEDVIFIGGSTFTVASIPEKFFSEQA